jgi:hypothetical protein
MSLPLAGVAVPLQQPTRFARPRQAVSIVEEKEKEERKKERKGKQTSLHSLHGNTDEKRTPANQPTDK